MATLTGDPSGSALGPPTSRRDGPRWKNVLFPPVPLERLAIFRILVTLFALVDLLIFAPTLLRYAGVHPMFFDPVYLLALPSWAGIDVHPVPPPMVYVGLLTMSVAALAAAAAGYRTRLALAVAAPLYLYHWALFNSWGKINHGKIPIVVALFALTVAPAGARLAVDNLRRRREGREPPGPSTDDRLAGWALRLVGAVVVASYLLSVVAKMTNSGVSWPFEPILAVQLRFAEGALLAPVAELLSNQPDLLVAIQILTLVIEIASVLAFVGGWPRTVVLFALAGLHLGSYLLIETEFFGFILCYAVFFRLEEGVDRIRIAGRSRRRDVLQRR